MNGRFIGIDLGKRSMVVCFMDQNQRQLDLRNFETAADKRQKLYGFLSADDVIGIEAGSLTFSIAKEIIREVGATVYVLHPAKLHFIFKSVKKTDSEDARKIAWYIASNPADKLYTVNLPSDQEIENRAIAHETQYISHCRTQQINRLHSIFVRQGITTIKKSHLHTVSGREHAIESLLTYNRSEAERLNRYITQFEEDINVLEDTMHRQLCENENVQYLLSVPGIAIKAAFSFLAYIGNGTRFSSGTEVTNFVGMVPRIDFSGDRLIMGHIHKRGPAVLRSLFVQAAWSLVRSKEGGELKQKYKDLSARWGKKIAIVAVARKMVALAWTLISRQEYYRNSSLKGRLQKQRYYKITFSGAGVLTG